MKVKRKVKMRIDLLMTILLLLLMEYQVTGEALHEYIGAGMIILFLLHNFLNIRWYGSLVKGKYPVLRILRTAVNFSCLAAMLIQAYSGIVLSRYVFATLPINGGMATARVMAPCRLLLGGCTHEHPLGSALGNDYRNVP